MARSSLGAAGVAVEIDVEPRRIAVAALLAQLGEPPSARGDLGGARPRAASAGRSPGRPAAARASSASISRRSLGLGDDELQLARVLLEQPARATARSSRRAAWSARTAAGRCGPGSELASFGDTDMRSQASAWKTVPAVSMVTCRPRSRSAAVSRGRFGQSSGSPPGHDDVARDAAAPPRRARRSCATPPRAPTRCTGVSHHSQRRLQPVVRMKNDGTPTSPPFALDRMEHLGDAEAVVALGEHAGR